MNWRWKIIYFEIRSRGGKLRFLFWLQDSKGPYSVLIGECTNVFECWHAWHVSYKHSLSSKQLQRHFMLRRSKTSFEKQILIIYRNLSLFLEFTINSWRDICLSLFFVDHILSVTENQASIYTCEYCYFF